MHKPNTVAGKSTDLSPTLKTKLSNKNTTLLSRYLKMNNTHEALLNIFKLLDLESIVMDYHAGLDGVEFERMEVNSKKYNVRKIWHQHESMEEALYNMVSTYIEKDSGLGFHVPVFDEHDVFEIGYVTITLQKEKGVPRLLSDKEKTLYYLCSFHYYVSDKHIEEKDKKVLIDFFGTYKNTITISEDLLINASSSDPKKREEAIDEIMEYIIFFNITGDDTIYTKEESEKAAKVLLKYIVPCYKTSIDSIMDTIDNPLIYSSYDYHYPEISIDIYQHKDKYNISLGILWSVNDYEGLITMGLHETEVIPLPTQ